MGKVIGAAGIYFASREHGALIFMADDHAATVVASAEERALTTAGQRHINVIWEYTQALIAIMVVTANIVVWVAVALKGATVTIPEGLSNALFLVVGFYFSRTNHTAIGGTGPKPNQTYEG